MYMPDEKAGHSYEANEHQFSDVVSLLIEHLRLEGANNIWPKLQFDKRVTL